MKEAIFIDGYLFKKDSNADGIEVEVQFISVDTDTLKIIIGENECNIYGEERIYDLFERITEIWYPHKEEVVSAD